jgi:trk system potassium uptake protein
VFALICGGGKVGYYLAKSLLVQNQECVLLERDAGRAHMLGDELGDAILPGDACDPRVLARAGIERADVVIAVTGDDEDNLVICQVAKRRFHTARTIARINNPKNEAIFVKLGIDVTISPTQLVLAAISTDLPDQGVVHLATLRQYGLELVELTLRSASPAVGRTFTDLALPPGTRLLSVLRQGEAPIYDRSLLLAAGDVLLATTRQEDEAELRRVIVGAPVTTYMGRA